MKQVIKSGIFWTILVGVLGSVLTLIIFDISNKNREPVYLISKEPSMIFDNENPFPNIQLLVNDTTLINENVYVVSVKFWNKGKLEIKEEDIRKDFTISFTNNATILDCKIIQQTKPDIANFTLENDNSKIKINWDYFDPNFGLELQIIYASNSYSDLIFEGYVLGAEIEKVKLKKTPVFLVFIALLAIVFSITAIKEGIKEIYNNNNKSGIFAIVAGIFLFAVSIYGVYDSLWNGVKPPL